MKGLPEGAYAAALAGFPAMTTARLASLLAHHPPSEALAVASGEVAPSGPCARVLADPALAARWRDSAAQRSPERVWEQLLAASVEVVVHGRAGYPALLTLDPEPPPVLFVRGSLDALERRRVGVVGTRNATQHGRDFAAELGYALGSEGAGVVSGLARGIDGAAHAGTIRAAGGRPIGVVANGLDQPYPRQHQRLWAEVAERGVLLSEWPPGTPPDAFRFPMRNRILAALSEVLVVVESRERGGSLITARLATDRDVPVLAVPGSVRCRAAAGTNALIRDGAAPVLDVDDVLVALGLDTRRAGSAGFDSRPLPRGEQAAALALLTPDPCTLEEVAAGMGVELGRAAIVLARLEIAGWVRDVGGWFERAGSASGLR